MTYAVVYLNPDYEVESVIGRGMDYAIADQLAAQMQPRARPGFRFTARNDNTLEEHA